MLHKNTTNAFDGADPDIQFESTIGNYGIGWQSLVTAIASAGNGQTLSVSIFGGHIVEGTTEYTLLHSEDITTATFTKPDGTTQAGYGSLLVQDPWGKYDKIAVRITGTGSWTVNSSLRTPGTSL
jgi:hypothetical protein